jgi:hypothetical protein
LRRNRYRFTRSASSSDMTGGTACQASTWRSDSAVKCKVSAGSGEGAPMRQGHGLQIVVTLEKQQGSRTQAWCCDAAVRVTCEQRAARAAQQTGRRRDARRQRSPASASAAKATERGARAAPGGVVQRPTTCLPCDAGGILELPSAFTSCLFSILFFAKRKAEVLKGVEEGEGNRAPRGGCRVEADQRR